MRDLFQELTTATWTQGKGRPCVLTIRVDIIVLRRCFVVFSNSSTQGWAERGSDATQQAQ